MNGITNTPARTLSLNIQKVDNESGFSFTGREGQIASCVSNKVYVFGGVEQGQGEEPKESNEMFIFDYGTLKWSKPTVSGSTPPSRSAASLVAVGTKLYLFGGLSHICGWFDDVHVFDTLTNTWSILETEGNKPRARDKLQAVAIDADIYYFGGFGPKSDEAEVDDLDADDDDDEFEDIPESREQDGAEFGWFNDLWILNTSTLKWTQPMQMNLGVPTQRAAHGMCAIGRNLIIFGGRDIVDRQNDIHIFNIDSRKWATDIQISGQAPSPRSFHSVTAVGSKAVVYGGRDRTHQHCGDFHLFDLDKKEWTTTTIEGYKPPSRGQHSAVLVGDSFFIFGGSGNFSPETMQCQNFFTDTFYIKLADFQEGNTKINGTTTDS